MTGVGTGRRGRGAWTLGLLALALFSRILVPAGWMPAMQGQGYAITLCTGAGALSAWVDDAGNVHKGKPVSDRQGDHPCAFAGIAAAAAIPAAGAAAPVIALTAMRLPRAVMESAVGRGLAAPPPPPTGPPATL